MTTDTEACTALTIASIVAEHDHLILPAELAEALGHAPGDRTAETTDLIETLADPDLCTWHNWARGRVLDVFGLAVQIERIALIARRAEQ